MALTRRVELVPLERTASGNALFSQAQPSDETLIADLAPHQPVSLFCHRRQTDQLILLRGSLELVVLENGQLMHIPLRDDEPLLVRIPPGVPHGAVNSSRHYATVVNAVLRHGPPDPRDYLPRPLPAKLMGQWRSLMGERSQGESAVQGVLQPSQGRHSPGVHPLG